MWGCLLWTLIALCTSSVPLFWTFFCYYPLLTCLTCSLDHKHLWGRYSHVLLIDLSFHHGTNHCDWQLMKTIALLRTNNPNFLQWPSYFWVIRPCKRDVGNRALCLKPFVDIHCQPSEMECKPGCCVTLDKMLTFLSFGSLTIKYIMGMLRRSNEKMHVKVLVC